MRAVPTSASRSRSAKLGLGEDERVGEQVVVATAAPADDGDPAGAAVAGAVEGELEVGRVLVDGVGLELAPPVARAVAMRGGRCRVEVADDDVDRRPRAECVVEP